MYKKINMRALPVDAVSLRNICGNKERTTAVCCWAPKRAEIEIFVKLAEAVSEGLPKIVDVGCGNGFLSYLMAETGRANVIGIDPNEHLIKNNIYSHPNLEFRLGDVESLSEKNIDVVINSYMPNGVNLTPAIRELNAKCIIYIKNDELEGATGHDETYYEFIYEPGYYEGDLNAEEHRKPNPVSRADTISYEPGDNYVHGFKWSALGGVNVSYYADCMSIGPAFVRQVEDDLEIDVQFQKDIPIPEFPEIIISDDEKYLWELQLRQFKYPAIKVFQRHELDSSGLHTFVMIR